MFDIVPQHGYRMLMDGYPGLITSDDDFVITSAGMMITETTITQFNGFDPNGKPEFMRSRKAAQYANSIDDYVNLYSIPMVSLAKENLEVARSVSINNTGRDRQSQSETGGNGNGARVWNVLKF